MSGCISCKKFVEAEMPHVEQGLESAFKAAFNLIQSSAKARGIAIPDELEQHLVAVGEAHGLFKATVTPLVANQ